MKTNKESWEMVRLLPVFAVKTSAFIGLIVWLTAKGACVGIWKRVRGR